MGFLPGTLASCVEDVLPSSIKSGDENSSDGSHSARNYIARPSTRATFSLVAFVNDLVESGKRAKIRPGRLADEGAKPVVVGGIEILDRRPASHVDEAET